MGKAKTRAQNKYVAKAYDRLYPFVPKGHKDEIQAAADRAGESLNEYIVHAIDMRMELEKPPEVFTPPSGEWCDGCKKRGGMIPPAADSAKQKLPYWEAEHPWCFAYGREVERDDQTGKYHKCIECLNDKIGSSD